MDNKITQSEQGKRNQKELSDTDIMIEHFKNLKLINKDSIMYKSGSAYIIASILSKFYDEKYYEIHKTLRSLINSDEALKVAVYEVMKRI